MHRGVRLQFEPVHQKGEPLLFPPRALTAILLRDEPRQREREKVRLDAFADVPNVGLLMRDPDRTRDVHHRNELWRRRRGRSFVCRSVQRREIPMSAVVVLLDAIPRDPLTADLTLK